MGITAPFSGYLYQQTSIVLNSVRGCVDYVVNQHIKISYNVVCATSKASDKPAHIHSLIRAFASYLNIL